MDLFKKWNCRRKLVNYFRMIMIALCIFAGSFLLSYHTSYAEVNQDKSITVVYFYYDYCKQCNEAKKIMDELNSNVSSKNTSIKLGFFMHDAIEGEGYKLLHAYFEKYNVPLKKQSVPIAFIGDSFFSGAEEIKRGLLLQINRKDLPETWIAASQYLKADKIIQQFSTLKAANIFFVGLLNGFNPCSLSMFLLFISMLLVKKVNVRKMGLAFAGSKFITYFLLGSILFNIFSTLKIQWFGNVAKIIALTFVVIIVVLNIRDYFFARNEKYNKIRMQLPSAIRKINHNWIKKAMSSDYSSIIIIMSLLLGIVISVGEFLCTGQIYLATILFVLHNGGVFSFYAALYLLVYNIGFILPIVAMTLIIDKSRGVFLISETIRKVLPLIKLINAFVFLIFGIIVVVLF